MSVEPETSAVRRFLGAALIAVGVMIGLLSGLCSVVTLFALVASTPREAFAALALVAVIGGPPMLLGWLLAWGGRRLRAPKSKIAPDEAAKTF